MSPRIFFLYQIRRRQSQWSVWTRSSWGRSRWSVWTQSRLRQIFIVNFSSICNPLHQSVIWRHSLLEALWSSIEPQPVAIFKFFSPLGLCSMALIFCCHCFLPDAFMVFFQQISMKLIVRRQVSPHPSLNNWIYRISFCSFWHMYL